jgi:hypothetical protein
MFPTILASGAAFQDQTNPTPVLKVRKSYVFPHPALIYV